MASSFPTSVDLVPLPDYTLRLRDDSPDGVKAFHANARDAVRSVQQHVKDNPGGGSSSSSSLVFNVRDHGALGDGTTDDTAALHAAFTAATPTRGIVYFPPGTYIVTGTLSLSGYSCSIEGAGASWTAGQGNPIGTVIKAVAQTGPVLNFTGYAWPGSHRGRHTFGRFAVEGDGTAGVAKSGINCAAAQTARFYDIVVSRTGGPGIDLLSGHLNNFDSIIVVTPIGAVANNVPYFRNLGGNGNVYATCGMRSMTSDADMGSGGAFVFDEDPNAPFNIPPYQNVTQNCWTEFLHPSSNSAIVVCRGSRNRFESWQFHDTGKPVSGATGVSRILLAPSVYADTGGNAVTGQIPGRVVDGPSYGVDITQNYNSVQGSKGFNGYNVRLGAGVQRTSVRLGGSTSGAGVIGWEDNSGQTNNVLVDDYLGTSSTHGATIKPDTVLASGVRVERDSAPANGGVALGNTGTRVQAVGTSLYQTADTHFFRNIALNIGLSIAAGINAGVQFFDHSATLPPASAALRGKVVLKFGAAGVADALYICRKDAADAYAWVLIS